MARFGKAVNGDAATLLYVRRGGVWVPLERWWERAGGGSTWEGITYDPVLNRVYFGVDGPSPWNAKDRRGDNLFTDSLVAVDADTGAYLWHFKEVPHDGWNYEASVGIMVADLPIDGQNRRVVVSVPRSEEVRFTDMCTARGLPATRIGVLDVLSPDLEVQGQFSVPLTELRDTWTAPLPALFG